MLGPHQAAKYFVDLAALLFHKLRGLRGQGLRKVQTGKVQQYAAILFAGATILAGIFIVLV